ncbi:MAG: hypothetical protein QUU85_09705, partial [Candidatus Eisenbacteria bacterium]|nr:hypothetical protein [Candidatus Eisenbacteria bacterium]
RNSSAASDVYKRQEYGRGPAMDRLHRLFVELHEGGDARGGEGLHAREQARERQQAGEREQAREREQEQEREPEQQGGGQAQAGGRGGEARARTAPAGRSS